MRDRATRTSEEIAELVAQMTLDEKASLTAGADMWTTQAVPRLGIPSWRMTDGPSGARGRCWGPAATPALALPTGSAFGATWDVSLLDEVGVELGREARARGARVLLAPTVNLQRAPLAGRTFECFAEDPYLSSALGAAFVAGVQSEGVAATVKHLAGNEAEWQRNSVDSIIDERSLRELYLLPFERCVRAGALAVMTAYNRLNGDHCPNNHALLTDVLRGEWGFAGMVITDWWGLLDTKAAAQAGLDLEMPGPPRRFGGVLAKAVQAGDVPEAQLDAVVTRILSVFARLGAWDDGDATAEWSRDGDAPRQFARSVSAASMVLIKNDRSVLPFDLDRLRRVAIIGPNAHTAQIMGGGSSQVRAHHRTPPVAALGEQWADAVELIHEPGWVSPDPTPLEPWELTTADGRPGFLVEYYDNSDLTGEPVVVQHGDEFRLRYLGPPGAGIPYPDFSARAAATFTAHTAGRHEFVLTSNARAQLLANGHKVDDRAGGEDSDWFGSIHERRWSVDLDRGEQIHLAVELVNDKLATYGRTTLACRRPLPADALDRAVRAAWGADAVVLVVGTSDLVETEGYDRHTLSLPAGQDELVSRVLGVNPNTVVVVNSGAPVLMPWLGAAPAVLQSWFGGQEMGVALADVLDGTREPGGRLPFTVPTCIEHTPSYGNFPGEAGAVRYGEGLLIGYRWYEARNLPVAVPFGHGLGYTSVEWSDIRLSATSIDAGESVRVELTVRNTGSRRGADVVQIYVAPPEETPLFRPRRELKGFAKVLLDPGESRTSAIELDWRAFAFWTPHDSAAQYHDEVRATPFAGTVPTSVPDRGWTVVSGHYELTVGRSHAATIARLPLHIRGTVTAQR